MIDWYIVLVPLAALPIVLLFVFVGCSLSNEGIASPFRLKYPPGLTGKVQEIEVWFKIVGEDGSSEDTKSLHGAEILAEGGFITPFIPLDDIGAEEEGSAECVCNIGMADLSLEGATLTHKRDSPHGWIELHFEEPNSFFLTSE